MKLRRVRYGCNTVDRRLQTSIMLQELPIRPQGYALKRKNHKFVVEPIEGIVNPAYEPDLDGDAKSERALANQRLGQSKWQV